MPTVQTKQLCDTSYTVDVASPISIAANEWGPKHGHYVVTPFGSGVGCAVRIERIVLIATATSLTSCKCSAALDNGNNAITAIWTGTVTQKSGTAYTIIFEPKTLIVLDHQPQALLDAFGAVVGELYFQFYSNVDIELTGFSCDYTIESVRPV